MEYDNLENLLKAFPNEAACARHLERLRWPAGIVCPHCARSAKIYRVQRGHGYKCGECKKLFSVRKGTLFEESRLPLRKWFAAAWLVTSCEAGISSHRLACELDITQKTAWAMLRRLREAAAGG